jgi:hypothetical protein
MRFTPRAKRLGTLLLPLVIVLLLLAPASTSARGAPSHVDWVHANGAVDSSAGFTSFHLFAASVNHGTAVGRAVFNDVPEAGGRLVVKVTCLNVMTLFDFDGTSDRRAFLSGPVVAAANGIGLGRPAEIGIVDGEQSTPTLEPDAIDAEFALDVPPFITCENAGFVIETPLLRGSVRINRE